MVGRRRLLAGSAAFGVAVVLGSVPSLGAADREPTAFACEIDNVSDETGTTIDPSGPTNGVPVVLSPGAFAVHTRGHPIFSAGEPERDNGLEEIAEDGSPARLVSHLQDESRVVQTGAFTTPVGAGGPGVLPPGQTYRFEFEAERPATYLSAVTMFVQSNDLFYVLGGETGLRLYEGKDPVTGDVTDSVELWDAGTEINEEPGKGANQAPRQAGAGVGLVERGTVARIETVNGYDYPPAQDVVRVTLSVDGM